MPLVLPLLELAAAAQALGAAPDIEFHARVGAREVKVRQDGEAKLDVHADPVLSRDVKVTRERPANGARELRNVNIRVDAQVTLADPRAAASSAAPLSAAPASERDTGPPD